MQSVQQHGKGHTSRHIVGAHYNGLEIRQWFLGRYLSKIEDSLHAEFPNTDLKGTQISALKKSYGSLRAILAKSGVGFNNHGCHKIDCTDHQWDKIVQCRCSEEVSYHPCFEDFIYEPITPVADNNEVNDNGSGNSGKQTSTTKTSHVKWKKTSHDTELMEFFGNLHFETNSHLEMILAGIGNDFNMGKPRHEIFDKLGTVKGLTLDQRYNLYNILCDKPQRLEVFIGMSANSRLCCLLRLIENTRKEG
ncbi:hypothetical protein SASPL_154377 [Salvia splendens]|uniref:Myb/SANT-like domain-containing protein n=1 Tax=Salvia splendens TaxID=180675 RepID=A0A8X8YYN6_SALSN|nr:hypothetical protein SASPL_154377 [Salvia splendens]